MSSSPLSKSSLLLEIPDARLSVSFLSPSRQAGPLSLYAVTLPSPPKDIDFLEEEASKQDDWLVILINNVEFPISANSLVRHSRINRSFAFKSPQGTYTISFRPSSTSQEAFNLKRFEVLLGQHAILVESDAAGRRHTVEEKLVRVEEDQGRVVRILEEKFKMTDEPDSFTTEKSVAVFEVADANTRSNSEGEDVILRSAQLISRGILGATDLVGKGMGKASSFYIRNSTPSAEPVVFSDSTHSNLHQARQMSGKALQVTRRGTGIINGFVDRATDKAVESPTLLRKRTSTPSFGGCGTPTPQTSLMDEPIAPDTSTEEPPSTSSSSKWRPPPKAAKIVNQLITSANLVFDTLDTSSQQLVTHTTQNLSAGLGHKYGPDVGAAVHTVGDSVQNLRTAYFDVRGVGRRAVLERVGKRVVKTEWEKRGTAEDVVVSAEKETMEKVALEGMGSPTRVSVLREKYQYHSVHASI